MNLKKLLLICLSALSIPVFAQVPEGLTADWFLVAQSKDQKHLFYANRKTIVREGDVVRSWIAFINRSYGDSAKSVQEINCRTSQQRDLTFISYKRTNFAEIDSTTNTISNWSYIVPDSLGDFKKEVLCAIKPR